MAARVDIKQIVTESRALPRSYFKGLNFLLNEQPDKAIEAFIEVVKVDPETIELHFALGSLFRRRGEYDRAIRMHQNLLERADLAADQKVIALAELGQDYLKAGILDRAEEVFKKLEGSPQANLARTHLLEIYEQEKDWKRAIEMTRQVDSDPRELAQYYCELATSEAAQSRPDVARGHLEAALEANRKCVRASLHLGGLERSAGRLERAIEYWKRIESQNPAYLALAAQRLYEAHKEGGRAEEGLHLLAGYLERYPSLDLLDTVFQHTLEAKGHEEAYRLVRDELRRNPTLLGLDRVLEAQIIDGGLNGTMCLLLTWFAIPLSDRRGEPIVRRNEQAGRLRFSTDSGARVAHGGLQLIAVGTPPGEDGSADLQRVIAAARSIGRHM